ncbi:ion transporter [Neolewinella antarctica]|uniref:Voltage-gated sodium channel n=1 Tax=Neolewinella antarctica TaxID=442734 RepID=A0ABX0X6X9_9BACT|nr:ion transporter [Neolewinella antarctica]NJC24956.1 voltage-gated sodium channel [Neolewinella antarctica]
MLKRLFLNERAVLVAIILNAAVIFALYFPSLRNNFWLVLLDQLFLLFFVVELIVKLSVLKPKTFFAGAWNRFDFIIVAGSLPVFAEPFMSVPEGANLLILLRLFRLVRLVRFLRFIPNIEQVVMGLGRAIKASIFVLAALVFLNFMLAILTCHFYARIAPEYFGNPLVSIYSIFQMFTLEGWNEIPAAITNNPDAPMSDTMIGLTRFYFVVVVVLGGIFGLSLANAVFIDEMMMDNNKELEAKVDALIMEVRALRDEGKNT